MYGFNQQSPVPGGGGASALAGALAACLGGMAVQLTRGKKKFIPVDEMLKAQLESLEESRQILLHCMDEDAAAFEPLSKAYGMPAETEQQKEKKQAVLETCLCRAAQPPMKILQTGAEVAASLQALSGHISKLVISDLGCAAAMARACMQCAAMNVWVNAQLMKDRAKAETLYAESRDVLERGTAQCETLIQKVGEALCR
ncbi:MAG: cyclodeaminase/cyclohydrolase family protein [Christensenellales bacterium]